MEKKTKLNGFEKNSNTFLKNSNINIVKNQTLIW
jgi:hypothetical protein